MSLPHLLLVDDSEAVLAFERAALSGHYALSTASNGKDALAKMPQLRPAAVLLDLSMPEMDGDEVLAHMQANAELKKIPVIIISSEKKRAEACLKGGAKAFLAKPIRAQDLVPLVARVLDEARREARAGNLAVLFVEVGGHELGFPLDTVKAVLHQTATRKLPLGPAYLREVIELYGEPVCVLDLARRMGVTHSQPVEERKLVLVEQEGIRIALCCDAVRDPEELLAKDLLRNDKLGGANLGPLREALIGIASTGRGPLPIFEPRALMSQALLQKLPALLRDGVAA